MLDQALADLRIYRAQWWRILSTTLYFLEVQATGETLYKIGVTQRTVEERIAEIAQELRAVAGDVTIRVLGAWPQRGNVELYFKHRYHAEQHRLGNLTEYVAFADVRPVLQDLRRMPPKGLTPLEQAVLADVSTAIELALAAEAEAQALEAKARARSAAIAWRVLIGEPIRIGPISAIARIWRGEAQLVAGVDATVLGTEELKRDLLAGVVQLKLGERGPADPLHPGLLDLDPERLALGGGVRCWDARRSFCMGAWPQL